MCKNVFFWLIIWSFSLGMPSLCAQETLFSPSDDIKKLLREAESYFRVREYSNAIPIYKRVLTLDDDHIEGNFYLALSYLKSPDPSRALNPLLKVQRLAPDYDPLLDFYLGEALKYNNEMEEAIRYYEKIKRAYLNQTKKVKIVNDEISAKDFIGLIDQLIREAKYGIRYLADPTKARVENIGSDVNSEYSDYAPVITGDESVLIFTSRRKGSTGKARDLEDNMFYEDIYITEKKRGAWESPKNLGKNINTRYHEASIALSPDGSQLFIYKDENLGDIYYAVKTGKGRNDWSSPRRIGGDVNSRYREPSVSITDDGKTLYFSSDRPGGYGGLDIYRSEMNDKGQWGEPENLGPQINTAEDEDSPFIHFDRKTLYFSSRGHQSMGGFDIFYSEFLNDQWTSPRNLGYPINTTGDDVHFVLSANYKTGYYASVKEDTYGEKDIYVVNMPDYEDVEVIDFSLSLKAVSVNFNPLATNDPRRAIVILRGIVKDELTDQLVSARMSLIDVEQNEVLEDFNSVSPKGVYYTQMITGRRYLLSVQKEGYMFHNEYFEIPVGVVNQEKVLNIYLKRIRLSNSVDFQALFDYNSAELTSLSLPVLQELLSFLENNPRIKGVLEGHTDNIGTEARNLQLSEERAQSVYNFLIERGIDKDRLYFRGYGESEPIADNGTAFGRSLNRRTVFTILEIN